MPDEIIDITPEKGDKTKALATTAVDPYALIVRAVDNNLDVDKLQQLLQLKREFDADVAKRAYVAAMAGVKRELAPLVTKTKLVSFRNTKGQLVEYKHAELADVSLHAAPILARHGFSQDWGIEQPKADEIEISCNVTHEGGHTVTVKLRGPIDTSGTKNAIQARASAVTYMQRYTLKAILGLAEHGDDDDGRAAGAPVEQRNGRQQAPAGTDLLAELADLLNAPELDDKQRAKLQKAIEDRKRKGPDALRKLRDGTRKRINEIRDSKPAETQAEAANRAKAEARDDLAGAKDAVRKRIEEMIKVLPAIEQVEINAELDKDPGLNDLLAMERHIAKRLESEQDDPPPPSDDDISDVPEDF